MNEFLIVARPPEHLLPTLGFADAATYGGTNIGFNVSPAGFDTLRIWPTQNVRSAPFQISNHAGAYTVAAPQGICNSLLANVRNTLLLTTSIQADAIQFQQGGNAQTYQRLDVYLNANNHDDPLNLPDKNRNHLVRELFKRLYVRTNGVGAATAMTLVAANGQQDDAIDAFLNPLILRLQLDGNECEYAPPGQAAPQGQISAKTRLAAILRDESCYDVVPLVDADQDLRVALLQLVAERRTDRRSVIDRLFWPQAAQQDQAAQQNVPQWLPFFALDCLRGQFYAVANAQDNNGQSAAAWHWHWMPGEDADQIPYNRQWYAHYWRKRWTDSGQDAYGQNLPQVVPLQHNVQHAPAWQPVQNGENAHPTSFSELRSVLVAAKDAGELNEWLAGVADFLNRTDELNVPKRWWDASIPTEVNQFFAEQNSKPVVDVAGVLAWFGGRYLLPQSEVIVEFPPADVCPDDIGEEYRQHFHGRAVSLRGSVATPELWFWKLFALAGRQHQQAAGAEQGDGCWQIDFGPGWWKDWFRGLFLPSSENPFCFGARASDSFKLGEARIGHERLGERPYLPQQIYGIVLP